MIDAQAIDKITGFLTKFAEQVGIVTSQAWIIFQNYVRTTNIVTVVTVTASIICGYVSARWIYKGFKDSDSLDSESVQAMAIMVVISWGVIALFWVMITPAIVGIISPEYGAINYIMGRIN